MIDKNRDFFQYNSGDLVYKISPLTGQLRTSSRKVAIKYVGPLAVYKIIDPQNSKTLVQLALENISSHCCTKWHHCVSEPSKLSIEGCKKWGSPIKLLVPVSLFKIANSHYACICKQMSNVLWGFKMIWFPYNSFVKVGWIQANPKLQGAWFILAFYKEKSINPRCNFMDWFQHPCL